MKGLFGSYRSPFLLAAILITILTSPFNDLIHNAWRSFALGFLWAVLIGYGGFLISESQRWLKVYLVSITIVLGAVAFEILHNSSSFQIVLKNVTIIFVQCCTLYVALEYAISQNRGNALDRTISAICGYFLLALLWTNLFVIIQFFDPAAFAGSLTSDGPKESELLYLSLINLTTLGYGDIVPVNAFARIVATLESAFGTLYLAVMVATLVSELRMSHRNNG